MLYLYHGTTSVCAIKARLTLFEKGLKWDGEILDLHRGDQHRPEYLKLNPNGVVPTLVHDGKVIIESTLIIEYLDEVFPDTPLMPTDPYERAQARLWMKKIDDYLHAACSTVTFAIALKGRHILCRTWGAGHSGLRHGRPSGAARPRPLSRQSGAKSHG